MGFTCITEDCPNFGKSYVWDNPDFTSIACSGCGVVYELVPMDIPESE